MQRFYDRCVTVVVVEATDGRWSTRGQGVFLFRHDHVPIFINNDNLHHVGGLSEKKMGNAHNDDDDEMQCADVSDS